MVIRKCASFSKKVTIFCAYGIPVFILLCYIFSTQMHSLVKGIERTYGTDINVEGWMNDKVSACGGKFTGYGHEFAVLQEVVLIPGKSKFFIPCSEGSMPNYWFDFGKEGTHLNEWMKNTHSYDKSETFTGLKEAEQPVGVAVLRYEYANLYHTMTDWYNVFLVIKLLDISLQDVKLILFDSYSKGHLDETWKTLFGNNISVSSLKNPIRFKKVIWCVIGYESPLNHHGLTKLPFVDQFHSFFLERHGVDSTKSLNCDSISILFLWRRDYVAHPNNPTGLISRKIQNENELIEYFKKRYPKANVTGEQLDQMSFKKQVNLISKTDVLISMHGAGLSHILFLPKHAGVIEMFTLYWSGYGMTHFQSMARWRGLKYSSWQNLNPNNEMPQFYTYIPPTSVEQHVSYIYKQICPSS